MSSVLLAADAGNPANAAGNVFQAMLAKAERFFIRCACGFSVIKRIVLL